jgi:hypothetical protein
MTVTDIERLREISEDGIIDGKQPEPAADSDEIYCVVCKHPIPGFRARRQTATCSEKCKNKLDVIRERQRAAKKCPACLHPSTPEEREEYRIWRAERGDIRSVARVVRRKPVCGT